jgi:hypothetical protein
MGAAVATTDCATAVAAYGGISTPSEIEDSSASDGPSEAAADAADASATTVTDSSSAADAPMAVPFYGAAPPK